MVIWSYGEKPYWSGFRGGRDEDSSGWGDDGNMRANGRNNGIVGRGEVGGWGEDRRERRACEGCWILQKRFYWWS